MPWKETTQVQPRVRFIEDWLAKEYESLAVLCRVHGVSRKTGYKWVGRFREGGRPALNDQPRRWRSQARTTVYFTALLINVGCHSDAHEQAKWFGDDIAVKAAKYLCAARIPFAGQAIALF